MTDPIRPKPRPPIGPQPPDPRERIKPAPAPVWTPFGPGDTATPDLRRILGQAAKTRDQLKKAQLELTRLKFGPGPDGTPPQVRDVTRADGQWPFLLIRYDVGDTGARPLDISIRADMEGGDYWSPDILLTDARPAGTPVLIDREDFPAFQPWTVYGVTWGLSYDIWVHVWNLGQVPATGVRVRAFLPEVDLCLGGTHVDLGDRLSPTCHRIVKVATYTAGASGESTIAPVIVVVECLSDVATGDRAPGMDRHCGQSWLRAN